MILVRRAGTLTSIQDLGRPGYRRYGIPLGGALDRISARLANRLVGNGAHAPLLEMTSTGPLLEFQAEMLIALTGADFQAKLNGLPLPRCRGLLVCAGDLLDLGTARKGYRAYLAVAGGLQAQRHWGSCSTYPLAKWGGLRGEALRDGDLLQVAAQLPLRLRHATQAEQKKTKHPLMLSCLPGPEWDSFSIQSRMDFFQQTFTVHSHSNRMAIRFREKWLPDKKPRKLLSSPVLPGTLQLTHGGELLLLMHDGPTTGGYPRFIVLTEESLHKAAQLAPHQKVVFALQKQSAEKEWSYL